jgi:sugar phosphate isomerase/epimerase
MIRPAFSTVACADWPLDRIAARCKQWGFPGIELRTFGDASREFACDPALTDALKIRRMFHEAGTQIVSLATSIGFDEPIRPPVIGNAIGDTERTVRAAKRAIDLAISIECPLVRVFGFEIHHAEPRKSALARIVARLKRVVDHAHRTGVRVVLENAGGFATSSSIIEIIDEVNSPLLGACFNIANAHVAGEDPGIGVANLGDRLLSLRVKDVRDGKPVPMGTGEVDWKGAIQAAARTELDEVLVYEWDRAWVPGLAEPDDVLPNAAKMLLGEVSRLEASAPASKPAPRRDASMTPQR